MNRSESLRLLNQALTPVAHGFGSYVERHSSPVRAPGDEKLHAFFKQAAAEDAEREEALVRRLHGLGGHPEPDAYPMKFGQYNYVTYARLLEDAPPWLERELGVLRKIALLGAGSTFSATQADATGSHSQDGAGGHEHRGQDHGRGHHDHAHAHHGHGSDVSGILSWVLYSREGQLKMAKALLEALHPAPGPAAEPAEA